MRVAPAGEPCSPRHARASRSTLLVQPVERRRAPRQMSSPSARINHSAASSSSAAGNDLPQRGHKSSGPRSRDCGSGRSARAALSTQTRSTMRRRPLSFRVARRFLPRFRRARLAAYSALGRYSRWRRHERVRKPVRFRSRRDLDVSPVYAPFALSRHRRRARRAQTSRTGQPSRLVWAVKDSNLQPWD